MVTWTWHGAMLTLAVIVGLWAGLDDRGAAAANGAGPDTTRSVPEGLEYADDETAEALAELDAAGLPPTADELADITAGPRIRYGTGLALYRGGWGSGQALSHSSRLHWSGAWGTVKGRWRQDRYGATEAAFGALVGPAGLRVAAGQIGLSHGYGLLVGAPGRGLSLTADSSLAPSRSRWLPWTGSAVSQALTGGGVQFQRQQWQLGVLVGSRPLPEANQGPTILVQAAWGSASRQVTGLLLSDPLERGAGVTVRVAGSAWDGACEVAVRRPTTTGRAQAAVLAGTGWRPLPEVRLEALAGWADPGPRPVMGLKNPLLGDWSGRGWALRGTWRVMRGLGARLLLQRGEGRAVEPGDARVARRLVEFQLEAAWPGGWRGQARWRSAVAETRSWSARFPWQAPTLSDLDGREATGLTLAKEGAAGKVQARWRRLRLSRLEMGGGWDGGGGRSLVSLAGTRQVSRGCTLRAEYSWAWGDPVDLVSAVVPFGGYVLPRHWGQWRSETLLGVNLDRGAWSGQAAVSRRQPEGTPQAPETVPASAVPVWAVWVQAGFSW